MPSSRRFSDRIQKETKEQQARDHQGTTLRRKAHPKKKGKVPPGLRGEGLLIMYKSSSILQRQEVFISPVEESVKGGGGR